MKAHLHTILTHLVLALVIALAASPTLAEASDSPGTVNINKAEVSQLSFLPRIGPALAQRIIDFREENGEFGATEDLILVRGIGEKTFAMLEPFISTEGETTLTRKLRSSDVEAAQVSGKGKKKAEKPATRESEDQESDATDDTSDSPN